MDQSPAAYCLKFGFCLQCTSGMLTSATVSTVYVIFVGFRNLLEEVILFNKWLYHLPPPPSLLPHLDLLWTTLQTHLYNIFTPLPIHFQKPCLPLHLHLSNWNCPQGIYISYTLFPQLPGNQENWEFI